MKKFLSVSVLLVVMAMFVTSCQDSSPSGALKSTIDKLIAEDYDAFVEGIYIPAKDEADLKQSRQQVLSLMKMGYEETKKENQGIKSVEILGETIEPGDTTAIVDIKMTYGNGKTEDSKQKMIKKDGKWLMGF